MALGGHWPGSLFCANTEITRKEVATKVVKFSYRKIMCIPLLQYKNQHYLDIIMLINIAS